MLRALEHPQKVKVNQRKTLPSQKQVDAARAFLILLPAAAGRGLPDGIPYGEVLAARLRRGRGRGRAEDAPPLVTDLPNPDGTRAVVARIPEHAGAFELLTQARELASRALEAHPGTLLIQAGGLPDGLAARAAEALVLALLTAVSPLPDLRRRPAPPAPLKRIVIHGVAPRLDLDRLRAEVLGSHLARWLTRLPGNELTPGRYRRLVMRLAKQRGWEAAFLDQRALARRRAGAFLAVTRGSAERDAGILHLRYRPGSRARRPGTALVGKGICFDTGGVNVKPARHMLGMHEDMAGSAVALGALLALDTLGVDFPVECWLALAQNQIGPRAYQPNDVVRACDGTTIEIVHTDAEGRMVLADTLALAARRRPGLIIDYATLTGSCIHALSSRYSGVFSNRVSLHETLIRAGRDSGERIWPFPMDPDYDEDLESAIADVRQCAVEGEADHIQAARFLNRFVPAETPWVHLDLAAANRKGGLAHVPGDTTGFGVRLTLNLLLDQHLPREAAP